MAGNLIAIDQLGPAMACSRYRSAFVCGNAKQP
jgi:hypothetical protein